MLWGVLICVVLDFINCVSETTEISLESQQCLCRSTPWLMQQIEKRHVVHWAGDRNGCRFLPQRKSMSSSTVCWGWSRECSTPIWGQSFQPWRPSSASSLKNLHTSCQVKMIKSIFPKQQVASNKIVHDFSHEFLVYYLMTPKHTSNFGQRFKSNLYVSWCRHGMNQKWLFCV